MVLRKELVQVHQKYASQEEALRSIAQTFVDLAVVLDEPVEFEMMGGMGDGPLSVRLIFMLAIKDPKAQVPTLQKMMAIIQNQQLLKDIREADTAEEAFDLIAPALAE